MSERFQVLDGWRGVSILLVLLGHLFPLGPQALLINGAAAGSGMVLFFILSGFLITNILIRDRGVVNFLIRRFARIVPLAWLSLAITLLLHQARSYEWLSGMLFFANLPPFGLLESTSHFWSLCVEVQFYLLIGLLVLTFGETAFLIIPLLAVAITGLRVIEGAHSTIVTYLRIDEILAGCILALIHNRGSSSLRQRIGQISPILLMPLLMLSAHAWSGPLNYLRPYIAMLLVGSTLFSARDTALTRILTAPMLRYLATVSYAVYILHGILAHTWLGSGDRLVKYAKRPLLLAATFGLAHISTNHYEKFWINLGRHLILRRNGAIGRGIPATSQRGSE